jgi:predicted component of type VI protein secretion system
MLAAIAAALCGAPQRSSARQLAILLPLVFSVIGDAAAQTEHPQISARRAIERKAFTDTQIAGGFFKIAFGAEFHVAGRVDRIRKYAGPVRVYVDSLAKPDRREQVAGVVADIRSRVKHLDIAMAEERDAANVLVTLVRDRDLPKTIRALYGRDRARQIQRSLGPQCLSGFRKDPEFRIIKSDVLLVVDAGDFIFYDCVYEELLQALGPINDDPTVPWSMFNDNVQMGFFDVYDQYLLNILYDPRIQPGMTREQVKALLPEILPDVRAFVASVNDLNAASSAAKPGKKRR